MPLGHGIEELWDAVRDRVEVSWHDPTWEVTAGCFETALIYARARFDDPAGLGRRDRGRWWPRVTLTVTTRPDLAAQAPRSTSSRIQSYRSSAPEGRLNTRAP